MVQKMNSVLGRSGHAFGGSPRSAPLPYASLWATLPQSLPGGTSCLGVDGKLGSGFSCPALAKSIRAPSFRVGIEVKSPQRPERKRKARGLVTNSPTIRPARLFKQG
jgi:hypothetical protein